jgi:alpha/beta superfamily hydrolase
MNAGTRKSSIAGPAGAIECARDAAAAGTPARGVAVLCHPHPLHGGTMDN